ncbi:MAG TPA: TadE/TadG family type IV pilus assembly protein [Acidimicrobiia bacterium]|nr:TadE/TadG family type IV pilus assembly protein [Acidimicrobiia bacterium]
MKRWGNRREDGANLVEFAILAPFLILLLFGIIEFGWLFSVNLDVRHGAREGARLAATDDFPNPGSPAGDVCDRMDLADRPSTLITISRSGANIGDDITVTVDTPATTLTGILDWAIPAGTRLQSTVTVRMEQAPSWSQVSDVAC